MTALTALVVDDDEDFRSSMELLVRREGFEVSVAGSLADARQRLETQRPDVIIMDLELPDGNGWEMLRETAAMDDSEVIVVTGHASVESAVEALQGGALDFLVKPTERARLKACLKNVARTRSLKREITHLREELRDQGRMGSMVGRSPAVRAVFDVITRVAPTDVSVLITGESGVGKELVAETTHRLSPRRAGPLVAVNCGALPANLIESELFGHERGAFTGADRSHQGCFERATGGTLLLDEITEMPIDLQVKLLRVLESRKISRVGGRQPIDVDVRVLAATNLDPVRAVAEGKLREDLYYRLNVFQIHVPPLREREGDVRLLALHFLDELNTQHGTHKRWDDHVLEELSRRRWKGNVRELRNAVSRAFILAEDVLGVQDAALHPDYSRKGSAAPDGAVDLVPPAGEPEEGGFVRVKVGSSISDAERLLIEATLRQVGGDKAQASKALGISLKTLYSRLKIYDAVARNAAGPAAS